jgi:hypothetical protein
MRILAILVVLLGWRVASAERAKAIAVDLRLDPVTAGKVIGTLRAYDGELVRLRDQRAELRRKMIDPDNAEKLLNDSIENNYSMQAAEELLISELRRNLSAAQTVRVLVLLAASEPDAMAPARADLNFNGRCDPFKQMHRCPN